MPSLRIEGLDHVAITVADLGRSRAFYEDVLGLKRAHDEWDVPVVMAGDDGSGLALFAARDPAADHPPAQAPIRIAHIALRVGREEFERARRDLPERGVEVRFSDHDIAHSIYLHDPDGHEIELTTYEIERD